MTRARILEVGVSALSAQGLQSRPDQVVIEEPLEIRLGTEPLAVIMRTPGDDLELAAGFLLGEGIVAEADDLETLRHCEDTTEVGLENVVNVVLSGARAETAGSLLARRRAERSTVTSASCGVCGKRSIESLQTQAPPFDQQPELQVQPFLEYPKRLREAQAVFDRTGGLHAAGVFDREGRLLVVREDIGRHNAVDKCVGYLLMRELLPLSGATLMVSGRCSFEIVQKALVARIQTVCAISAPSSLAISLAQQSKMGLLGFVREGSLNVYAPDGHHVR